MHRASVVCLGHGALDHVFAVDTLPRGSAKVRASAYAITGGGMAANAAVAIARLGGSAHWWGRVGDDDTGRAIRAGLAAEGVDCAGSVTVDGARSSASAVIVDREGERMLANFRGEGLESASAATLPLADIPRFATVLADIRWPDGAHALFTAARAAGVPSVLDADVGDSQAIARLLPLADHALFSEQGLREWTGDADIAPALERAAARGCVVAAVTLGERGVVWRHAHRTFTLPACAVRAVETLGAGDVFHGAYALAVAEGTPIVDAMRFASAAAALKCAAAGGRATFPRRADVDRVVASAPRAAAYA